MSHARMRRFWPLVLLSSVTVQSLGAAASPKLTRLYPAGLQRGTSAEIQCDGEFDWPLQVDAPQVSVTVLEAKGAIRVTAPDDLATDRVWLRFYTDEGSSEPQPLLIGSVVEQVETEPNNTLDEAEPIRADPVTINGVLNKDHEVDSFLVDMAVGQTLVASLDANGKLGSPMDAVLQVVDRAGVVLAENHDDVGLDPRVAFTATRAGPVLVRVFAFPANPDTRIALRGNDSYVYRLTLTTGPFIAGTVPMSVPDFDRGAVEVFGWNVPPRTKLAVQVPDPLPRDVEHEASRNSGISPERHWGWVFHELTAGAAPVRCLPHATQRVLADPGRVPLRLELPTAVAGWLRVPEQTDVYEASLVAGDTLAVSVESIGFRLPVTPLVRLVDPSGSTVANSPNNGPAEDVTLLHRATVDGIHRLEVSDRFGQAGPLHRYQLTARIAQADFSLSFKQAAVTIPSGEEVELPIAVERFDVGDPKLGSIRVEAVDLPAGMIAAPIVSEPEGDSAKQVSLRLKHTGPAYSGPIRVRGTTESPRPLTRTALAPERLAARFSYVWVTAQSTNPANDPSSGDQSPENPPSDDQSADAARP